MTRWTSAACGSVTAGTRATARLAWSSRSNRSGASNTQLPKPQHFSRSISMRIVGSLCGRGGLLGGDETFNDPACAQRPPVDLHVELDRVAGLVGRDDPLDRLTCIDILAEDEGAALGPEGVHLEV